MNPTNPPSESFWKWHLEFAANAIETALETIEVYGQKGDAGEPYEPLIILRLRLAETVAALDEAKAAVPNWHTDKLLDAAVTKLYRAIRKVEGSPTYYYSGSLKEAVALIAQLREQGKAIEDIAEAALGALQIEEVRWPQ